MLSLEGSVRIWLCTEPTDMRKSFNGLAAMVKHRMDSDPLNGHYFVFVNRRKLNEKVLPYYEAHELPMLRILTDRGTEYCGKPEQHDYQLYLALNDIDHTRTKARHPQTNGIVERFHKTILNEFYQVTFRKNVYSSLEQLQYDLDEWLIKYNTERTHQGKMCCGRTPFETLLDGQRLWKEKQLS